MEIHPRRAGGGRRLRPQAVRQEGRERLSDSKPGFRVHIDPGGHEISVAAGENVLAAALAAGIPLPHSCRAGRCASCKARLIEGRIAYPEDRLPPGIVASEAARGEVLLCQAMPRSNLRIAARLGPVSIGTVHGVIVDASVPLSTGGARVTLRFLGTMLPVRPGQFIDVETATGERERVPVVRAQGVNLDVEVLELTPRDLVRARGPFDAPR